MIFILYTLISLLFVVLAFGSSPGQTNSSPRLPSNVPKGAFAAVAVAGLGAGKLAIDGPRFNEAVDLTGKVVVITGGNTGLGKEQALKLVSLGADLFVICKSREKGEATVSALKEKAVSQQRIGYFTADLGDLKSVKACSDAIHRQLQHIDVLCNNAGVMAVPERSLTKDGFEMHMGINHIGHFALTAHLTDLLQKSKAARIINVASQAYLFAGDTIKDDWMFENSKYQPWQAYGNSKLTNILFTKSLAARLKAASSPILTFSLHPGGCRTELGRYILDPSSIPKIAYPLVGLLSLPLVYATKSAEQGAQTQIYLSASKQLDLLKSKSGAFFDNSKAVSTSGKYSNDMELAELLWDRSVKATGVEPKFA